MTIRSGLEGGGRNHRARVYRVWFRWAALFAFVVSSFMFGVGLGCRGGANEESTPTPIPWQPETPTPPTVANGWVSEGDDVAQKLTEPPLRYVRIVVTFYTDNRYIMEATDAEGQVFDFSGDFVTKESTVAGIYRIMLFESSPDEIAYEGMYQIDTSVTPNVMQYEVVQVQPYAGLEPPDEQAGFGSTNGGAYGDGYVQIYRRN